MVLTHGQEGGGGGKNLCQCGQEGEGSNFLDFVRTSFMDGP